jgi:hypothetical protein
MAWKVKRDTSLLSLNMRAVVGAAKAGVAVADADAVKVDAERKAEDVAAIKVETRIGNRSTNGHL